MVLINNLPEQTVNYYYCFPKASVPRVQDQEKYPFLECCFAVSDQSAAFNVGLRSSHWGLRKEFDSHEKTPQKTWKENTLECTRKLHVTSWPVGESIRATLGSESGVLIHRNDFGVSSAERARKPVS
ncbi:hypothetical protein AVEN_91252-1 [Araneus ventricosus]|uniref:Uncharacterized protein n=1 Tax=Araneus ventricosus TaxID=182803 RepID=A0A4Y2GFK4_ARAVE|nr:hypothetical protein AVEN_91252-1 [Araneus ventricosus]